MLCVPLNVLRSRNNRDPWITPELIEIIRDKDRALKRETKN